MNKYIGFDIDSNKIVACVVERCARFFSGGYAALCLEFQYLSH